MSKALPTPTELYRTVSKDVLQPARPFINETWHARVYGRKISIYLTWLLLHTSLSANRVSWLATAVGVLAGVVLALPHYSGIVLGFLLIQLHMLLDNADGEVARYRQDFSPLGNYIDKIMHVFTHTAVLVGLGVNGFLAADETMVGTLSLILGLVTALGFTLATLLFQLDPPVAQHINKGSLPPPNRGGINLLVRNAYQALGDVVGIS